MADIGDRHHADAAQVIGRTLHGKQYLVTTNHVIGETYTLMRMRLGYAAAQEFLRRSRASARTKRVFVPEAWEDEAETVLAQFADQDFSFVDATSFVVMRKLELRTAFAFDHHFLIAGYLLLAAG